MLSTKYSAQVENNDPPRRNGFSIDPIASSGFLSLALIVISRGSLMQSFQMYGIYTLPIRCFSTARLRKRGVINLRLGNLSSAHAINPRSAAAPSAPPAARTGTLVAGAAPLDFLVLVLAAVVDECFAVSVWPLLMDVEVEVVVEVAAEARAAIPRAKMPKNCMFSARGCYWGKVEGGVKNRLS